MDTSTIVEKAQAGLSPRRVFSEPIEQDGTVVVLAAQVRGGAGGGEGTQPGADGAPQQGTGSGFGLAARPAGAFVVRSGKVRWLPAIDVNRVILGAQLVAITGLLLARAAVRLRLERERRLAWRRLGRRAALRRLAPAWR